MSKQKFREETRQWLEDNCPQSMREPVMNIDQHVWASSKLEFPSEDSRIWFERMVEKGWCVPDWPREYGGGGLSPAEADILEEEMQALNCRPPQYSFGTTMIGPVLLEFGSEEQKAEFLPKIARGQIRWCQGYSEPGAGSDLAGLRTAAADQGDHYRVTGSKIWTSHAHKADWMYCLARTDPNAPKQRGISFLLIDMHQPGISARPIRLLSGDSDFCEVFLDNVRAEKQFRIGAENEGWAVAKRLLVHERNMMADLAAESRTRVLPLPMAREALEWREGRIADPVLRQRLAASQIERQAVELSNRRVADEIAARQPSAAGLMLKLAGTEAEKRSRQLIMDMAGYRSLRWDAQEIVRSWLNSYGYTIAGGSSEIQLNIIAKRVLALPA